jgi:outer membrane protein TolC
VLIFILVVLFLYHPDTQGQDPYGGRLHGSDSAQTFNPYLDDISLRIPPLEDLIDSAIVHSPLLKVTDADISIARYRIKTARRDWMQNLYIDGMLQTDVWDALTNNRTSYGDDNTILSYQDNYRYLAAMSFRLPLDDLWDRHNRIKAETKFLEKNMAVRDNQILELRKSIIEEYNTLIVTQKILKIANDNVIANALQKEMGDKEFVNGQTTLYQLAYINEMYRKAVTDFEQARIEFYNSYMILQEICGIKFNVINKIE